jgi:hypothetical protein
LYTGRYTAVHTCIMCTQHTVDLWSIVPTAVGTSHFHRPKCPQLWSDKFRPWSISAGGTPQSVLLYDGCNSCNSMCTQTEFSDLLQCTIRGHPTKRLLKGFKMHYRTSVILSFFFVTKLWHLKIASFYVDCMKPGCIGKSNTNNSPAPTDLTGNPYRKKHFF